MAPDTPPANVVAPDESTVAASRPELRDRAVRFAATYATAHSEQAERQTFWNDLFAIFGIERRQVAAFEELARRSSTGGRGRIDLLYPGQMGVEHKSAGENLDDAMGQLVDYLPSLTQAQHPWLLVVCDFQRFAWRNLNTDETGEFTLAELPDNLDLFMWMAGYRKPGERFENEEDTNLKATELLRVLQVHVRDSGYPTADLREWMTRVLFCLFADDTGVWDRAAFHAYIALRTRPDGSDLGAELAYLFQILNTPPERRPGNLPEDVAQFTYINGDLFETRLAIPTCDEAAREALLEACSFDWSAISPAIFGSMFQNVMTAKERRQLGAHYTTEANILRVARPLFLDDLEQELQRCTTQPTLRQFLIKLSELKFLDPACGCGNFLVIAYRELRRIETDGLRRLRDMQRRTGQMTIDITLECRVRVDQFYGIEIEEFPAKIARTALYLIDHLANRKVSKEFGQHYVRFPIPAAPHVVHGNALRIDWATVLPASDMVFVYGNPPFVGKKVRTAEQKEDMGLVFGDEPGTAELDYVAAWYEQAAAYVRGTGVRVAFVSTNSITQGEQVPLLWPRLLDRGFTIGFAHRTFEWTSEAKGKAHVHCVIVGFCHGEWAGPRTLYDYETVRSEPIPRPVSQINGYLIDYRPIYVNSRREPLRATSRPTFGSMPNDGGYLLLNDQQASRMPDFDPEAAKFIRELVSAREWLHGERRWCFWLTDATAADIRSSRELTRRVEAVRTHRTNSKRAATRALANAPHLFGEMRQPTERYLCVPRHPSEARRLMPMAFFEPDVIVSDSCIAIPGADMYLFGVLQSSMFTAWTRTVGGRIKNDLRPSIEAVYYTFPFPDATDEQRRRVAKLGDRVVEVRAKYPDRPLSDLYDPLATPPDVSSAHDALDRAVEGIFAPRRRLTTDALRAEVLFEAYDALINEGRMDLDKPETPRRRIRRPRR